MAMHQDRPGFHRFPRPRAGVIRSLRQQLAGSLPREVGTEPVLLSFACDPLQPVEAGHGLTLQAVNLLVAAGLRVAILTKGGRKLARPVIEALAADPLGPGRHWFGVSLTCTGQQGSLYWEPGAAEPRERMRVLEEAKAHGLATWASFEPVLEPRETLDLARDVICTGLVDHLAVGKLNYHPRAREIHWPSFRRQISAQLADLGLARAARNLPEGGGTFFLKRELLEAA
jgi:DNA repair photolyase